MYLTLEEIIKRCEGMYQISQINPTPAQIQAYEFVITSFLDICLLFEDIPSPTYTEITAYYKNKLNGIQTEPLLMGYDATKFKLKIINELNNKKGIELP